MPQLDKSHTLLQQMRDNGHELVTRGEGNAVSVEFNMLYRWHATLSEEDAKWTEDHFRRIFDGKEPSKVCHELGN